MPVSRLLHAYLTEARYETVRMLRTPAFAIPFLGLPVLLYLLFGVVIFGDAARNDPQAGMFIFTAFSVFGVMGPGIFGFGMVVAIEREQGLLKLKRALPMPPAAYLLAKMLMALMFALIVMATMIVALPLGHLKLTACQALAAAAINILGLAILCGWIFHRCADDKPECTGLREYPLSGDDAHFRDLLPVAKVPPEDCPRLANLSSAATCIQCHRRDESRQSDHSRRSP